MAWLGGYTWNDPEGIAFLIVMAIWAIFGVVAAPLLWMVTRDHAKNLREMHERRKERDIT